MVVTTAVSYDCPACNAPAGQPCTTPTDTSRRKVPWFHQSRESKLLDDDYNPFESDPAAW